MIKSTRLRYIKASTPDELSIAVTNLPFKIEIKGGPVKDGKKWIVWFVPPDSVEINNADI